MKLRQFNQLLFGLIISSFFSVPAKACGGFFCDILPINQAGEQIIFRKDGDQITTMVQIQYSGAAEDFGWVLPVPTTPELSIGSNLSISELELFTRPQFFLERTGEACAIPSLDNDSGRGGSNFENDNNDIIIEDAISVGPFDAQIISGDDPAAVANWLAENNLDLTERGEELLTPYVEANMKFVVLKLRSTSDVGDIQPIIMKYESEVPMIPIRLTAIAAQEDMGILVWLLGENRAVPDNYLHVTPNYTRLNWYVGSQNAYVSYQNLITEAMDEAGGQGFATDYAGRLETLATSLTGSETFNNLSERLAVLTDAGFISEFWNSVFSLSNQFPFVIPAFNQLLPLTNGQNNNIYSDPLSLEATFTAQQLSAASAALFTLLNESIIEPLNNSVDILDDDLYLTRLYTTLSPEEMTLDPTFVFNPDLPNQQITRNATLDAACTNEGTRWTLTLGEGTGRDGEQVIVGGGEIPVAAPDIDQEASFQIAKTSSSGSEDIVEQNDFALARVNTNSGGGGSLGIFFLIAMTAYLLTSIRAATRKG